MAYMTALDSWPEQISLDTTDQITFRSREECVFKEWKIGRQTGVIFIY